MEAVLAQTNTDEGRWTFRQKLVGIVVSPKRTFEYLLDRPDILSPLTLLSSSTLFLALVITPSALEAGTRANQAQVPAQLMNLVIAFSIAFALTTAVGSWLFSSLIYYVLSGLMGKVTSARATLSVFGYTLLPVMFRNFLRTAAALTTGDTLLASTQEIVSRDFVGNLSASADLFIIWSLILAILGFSVINKITIAKSTMFISSIWVFGLLLQWEIGMRGFKFS